MDFPKFAIRALGASVMMLLVAACTPTTPPINSSDEIEPAPVSTMVEPDNSQQARQLMDELISDSPQSANAALKAMIESGDSGYVAVMIEVMRAIEIGIADHPDYRDVIAGLEQLSGQDYGDSWPAWIEWYGGTELEPPPGFTAWKGQLFARIDPDFASFFQGDAAADFRVEEVVWGGVVVDGIPALDDPVMVTANQADYLNPGEPVFGIEINGEARAYPLRIMDWHEMANDTVAEVPFSLAYCTLCGAGIAYDGRGADGRTYTFGSSGLLYRSNKLMYDRESRTLWNQLTGQPVLGELVGSDLQLELLPVVLSPWEDWRGRHPETLVLSLNTGYARNYSPGAAYGDYFSATGTMFPVWNRDNRLATKERVFTIRVEGVPKAYPLEALERERVVNDLVAGTELVIVMSGQQVTVEGDSPGARFDSYQAGGSVRAFERSDYRFRPGPASNILIDQSGDRWQLTEEALIGPTGERLERLPGHLAYWFGWFSFFPQTEIYGGS